MRSTTMRGATPYIQILIGLSWAGLLVGLLGTSSVFANDSNATDSAASETSKNETATKAPHANSAHATPLSQNRAQFHAAQDPGVDAAVNAIVQELAAVGSGPRKTRNANPAAGIDRSLVANPVKTRGLGSITTAQDAAEELAGEAAAVRALPGGDEGEDDHAM